MRLPPVVAGSWLAVAACAAPVSETSEPMQAATHSIVGGTLSTAAQDATVLVMEAGSPSCSGVLVAPNLVLTARHCVTYFNESSECGAPLRGEIAPSLITVSAGVYANPKSPAARATRFFVPAAQNLCSDDIALVALDKDVQGITPVKVRFGPVAVNEVTTAIGYGTQGSGRRQRADVKVLALGPANASYTTATGQKLAMNVHANEVATTESTCYGDSGGPLLDGLGQVVAVASRGLDDLCIDRPTFWTSLSAHQQLVRDAAAAVGHPLAEAAAPPPRTTNAASGTGASTAEDDLATTDDGEDDTPTKRARKPRDPAVASAGCSIGTSPARTSASLASALAAALVLAVRRSRRSSARSDQAHPR